MCLMRICSLHDQLGKCLFVSGDFQSLEAYLFQYILNSKETQVSNLLCMFTSAEFATLHCVANSNMQLYSHLLHLWMGGIHKIVPQFVLLFQTFWRSLLTNLVSQIPDVHC